MDTWNERNLVRCVFALALRWPAAEETRPTTQRQRQRRAEHGQGPKGPPPISYVTVAGLRSQQRAPRAGVGGRRVRRRTVCSARAGTRRTNVGFKSFSLIARHVLCICGRVECGAQVLTWAVESAAGQRSRGRHQQIAAAEVQGAVNELLPTPAVARAVVRSRTALCSTKRRGGVCHPSSACSRLAPHCLTVPARVHRSWRHQLGGWALLRCGSGRLVRAAAQWTETAHQPAGS